ncbi:hypothetical protein [Caulobacter sp. S45]|uniref:hypothetical protein n=1 Tax=Caulobacter sp. S45 TaxID=1641861 RepID=UPI001575F2A9|nr:hypothetical protein [Caulobacter sp. S45]
MTGEELETILRERWLELIKSFNLSTAANGENRAYVSGPNLLLQIFATRDGVDITYIDRDQPTLPLYSINSLMLRARRDRLVLVPAEPRNTSFYDYVRLQLDVLARHLSRAGTDVLRGERGWMTEHGPSRADASADIRAFLNGAHTFRPVDA